MKQTRMMEILELKTFNQTYRHWRRDNRNGLKASLCKRSLGYYGQHLCALIDKWDAVEKHRKADIHGRIEWRNIAKDQTLVNWTAENKRLTKMWREWDEWSKELNI